MAPSDEPFYEPLTARDAWFLYAERPQTPLDLGTVYVFEGESQLPGGRGALGVEQTVRERIHLVPRYRQRIHRVPLNLAHPVWVDDPHFDLGAHIRREVLPPPGDGATLRQLVMRILSRPLDMRRPLWEMTIVTGLRGGRVVIVNRAKNGGRAPSHPTGSSSARCSGISELRRNPIGPGCRPSGTRPTCHGRA